jgi:hypothetical protein
MDHALVLTHVARHHQQHCGSGIICDVNAVVVSRNSDVVCRFPGLRALLEAMQRAVPAAARNSITYRHESAFTLLALAEDAAKNQAQVEQKRQSAATRECKQPRSRSPSRNLNRTRRRSRSRSPTRSRGQSPDRDRSNTRFGCCGTVVVE